MPKKTWAIGEEVIAADFNPNVADQVVAVFASAAARTAGWPAPPEGAVTYLTDTNVLRVLRRHRVEYASDAAHGRYAAEYSAGENIQTMADIAATGLWRSRTSPFPRGGRVTVRGGRGRLAESRRPIPITTNVIWTYNGGAAHLAYGHHRSARASGNVEQCEWSYGGTADRV